MESFMRMLEKERMRKKYMNDIMNCNLKRIFCAIMLGNNFSNYIFLGNCI